MGDGVNVRFPFVFKVFSKDNVRAIYADALGAELDLTLGSDFTVNLNPDRPIFYSKSDPGFYCIGIHGDAIPKDAVAITREEHRALLKAQSKGKVIQADEKGYPIAVDRPQPTLEELKEMALNRRRARMATAYKPLPHCKIQ